MAAALPASQTHAHAHAHSMEKLSPLQKTFFQNYLDQPDVPMAVHAIKALTEVISASRETTMMGLQDELKAASQQLIAVGGKTLSLSSACDLFARFVTRTIDGIHAFDECKARIIERGNSFGITARKSRRAIADLGKAFVRDGSVVLTHSYSRVVAAMLLAAAAQNKRFSVIVTETQPDGLGFVFAEALRKEGLPVEIVLDCAVGKVMARVDFVLVGAEGVVESGGIINKLGTLTAAICARAFNRPVYVAAESFKFTRVYPIDQADYPVETRTLLGRGYCLAPASAPAAATSSSTPTPTGLSSGAGAAVVADSVDYTPPEYITLLITDLGILTPSAVSDELIQLYC